MRPLNGVPGDRSSSLGCFNALTGVDAPSPDDTAAAAYWLTHPDPPPTRRKTLADLIAQWESEPQWNGPAAEEEQPCPE